MGIGGFSKNRIRIMPDLAKGGTLTEGILRTTIDPEDLFSV